MNKQPKVDDVVLIEHVESEGQLLGVVMGTTDYTYVQVGDWVFQFTWKTDKSLMGFFKLVGNLGQL